MVLKRQVNLNAVIVMKLSIIVPVYKVEQYLRKCVDSLLDQDLPREEYEIILVDDGSPDGCPTMCDEYASSHANVRVVHRENGGLSAARNSGIEMAQGQYVQFLDSDDYLEPDVLKTLVDMMDADHLDILRFNYQNVNEKYEVFKPNKVSKPFVDYRDEVCDGLAFLNERLGFGCYAWQFMLRRELLENCVFKEGIYFEDVEWTPRLLLKASRVTSTDLMVYNYLMRMGSITQSVDEKKKRKLLDDKMMIMDLMLELAKGVDDKRWFEGSIAQSVIGIIGSISKDFYGSRKPLIKQLKEKGVFPLSYYHCTSLAARKIRIANISPRLLCFMLHLSN